MFTGFDVDRWDDHIVWMWRWSNLRFIGFYLAHGADGTRTTWTNHWHDLKDLGWGTVPIWLPFGSGQISDMANADGNDHGRRAVSRAREASIERGAAIYLDVEAPVFGTGPAQDRNFTRYLTNWFRTVAAAGYTPGVYCSRLDAPKFLGADFRTLAPTLFPFSIPTLTRAAWDDRQFKLTPARAESWDVGSDPSWPVNSSTIGCQYDWFNAERDRKIFHWPGADGRQDTFRDVDWDMAKVFDPSHPKAAGVVTAAGDRANPGSLHIFVVQPEGISHQERTPSGRLVPGQDLAFTAADIGPTPAPEVNGFDSFSAAAVSRRTMYMDLFLLGQDGYIRTLWSNSQDQFPKHPWAVNSGRLARRGSPVASVSRELDQIDIFYVTTDFQLATQWWHPTAVDWAQNQRTLVGPLVAGGSNIAALARPQDATSPSRLDVFYIGLDYARPYADPRWNDGWQIIHAAWSSAADWQLAPIAGLNRPAATTGVAAVRDTAGVVHVVVQSRDRATLQHATLPPDRAAWNVANGPNPLPADTDRRTWWMSLQLVALPGFVLLIGMTSAGALAWSSYVAGRWSDPATGDAAFATNRPLSLAPRNDGATIDILGISEDGSFLSRSLSYTRTGTVQLVPLH